MITIIHGEDTAKSRNYLFELKGKASDALFFEGSKVQIADFAQILEGGGLFSEEKNVFIDDFFSKRKGKDFEDIISYITTHEKEANVYFWESKDLTTKQLSYFKKAQVYQFKLPQALFTFLDSLKPHSTTSISLFHTVLEVSEPELVFFMLVRHFRLLLALSEKSSDEPIDEIKRMKPWQMGKLQKQATLFSEEKLKKIYAQLLDIDISLKTGTTSLSTTQAIDFLLADL